MLLDSRYKKDTQQQQKLKLVDKISRRSFPLPPELLYEILNYLESCQPALYSACLVCKQWFYCAAPILYCHPQIKDTYLWATFVLTLTRERMTFSYGNLVRSIDLSSGKSIEAMKDQEFYRRLSSTNITLHDNNAQNNQHGNRNASTNDNVTTTISNYAIRNSANVHVYTRSNNNHTNSSNHARHHQYEHHIYNNGVPPTQAYNAPTIVPLKGLPYIVVSTSSLIQLSHTCKYITTLNLSYTSLLNDSVIAETGEYLSTLQHYAKTQPGLTHIQIPIEAAIKAIGKECQQLVQVKVQRCEWVTAHVIWMFVYYCKNLKRLDARRSTKCTVKKLIASVLESTELLAPSSSSSGPSDNNDRFDVPLPSSSISSASSTASTDIQHHYRAYMPRNRDDDMDDMDQLDLNDHHLVFNEETGSYEQHGTLGVFSRSRASLMRQLIEDEQRLHGTFWFVPLPNSSVEDYMQYIARRPTPSLHHHHHHHHHHHQQQQHLHHNQQQHQQQHHHSSNHSSPPIIDFQSLKDVVKEILDEAKHSGIADISWLQDYPL